MENTTQQDKSNKVATVQKDPNVTAQKDNSRSVSKVTVMKTFKSLGDRLQETGLLNKEEFDQFAQLYAKAFERFVEEF